MQEFAHEFAQQLYLNPSEFSKMGGLWLLRLGHNLAKPSYQNGPKRIECYSLHFVVQGELLLQYEHQEVILQAGDICSFFPDESYSYRIYNPDKPLKLIWIAFQGPQAAPLMQSIGFKPSAPFVRARLTKEVEKRLHATMDFALNHADDLHSVGFSMKLQEGLYSIFAELMEDGRGYSGAKSNAACESWLQRSLDFIRLHYMEEISVKEMAEAAGVHRSYYSDVFKKVIGVSPYRYLYRLKMEKAAELIALRDRSITEIAYTVGYPSLYSFSRAYRNYFGYSPVDGP